MLMVRDVLTMGLGGGPWCVPTKPVYLETLPGDPAFNLGAHLCEDTGGERLGLGCPGKKDRGRRSIVLP